MNTFVKRSKRAKLVEINRGRPKSAKSVETDTNEMVWLNPSRAE